MNNKSDPDRDRGIFPMQLYRKTHASVFEMSLLEL